MFFENRFIVSNNNIFELNIYRYIYIRIFQLYDVGKRKASFIIYKIFKKNCL